MATERLRDADAPRGFGFPKCRWVQCWEGADLSARSGVIPVLGGGGLSAGVWGSTGGWGVCWGGTLACTTAVCSLCSSPEHRNTIFKISPGFAQHPAAGRRIPAKKKGRFPASKPTVPMALARSRQSFASCWGPSRGLVSPRPPSPTLWAPSIANGVPLWVPCAGALGAFYCSLFCSL